MSFVQRVKYANPDYFHNKKVLEVGSLDINGSVRQFFDKCIYIGCDLGEGKGVDVISRGHELKFDDNFFNTSISCECFEHDKFWKKTFENMVRMTSGLVVFTCATVGRKEHGTTATSPNDAPFTNDYYKNLVMSDFANSFDLDKMFKHHYFETNHESHDLYFYGIKHDTATTTV